MLMEYANNENDTIMLKSLMVDKIARAFRKDDGKGLSVDPRQMSPLVLAYIGDTVFDLFIRTKLVCTTTLPVHGLHARAAKCVCAKAQAEAFRKIEELLTEEEMYIFKRGRNAHMGTVPKNAQISDYRHATGLEALAGYLFLLGQDERLCELMKRVME